MPRATLRSAVVGAAGDRRTDDDVVLAVTTGGGVRRSGCEMRPATGQSAGDQPDLDGAGVAESASPTSAGAGASSGT